MLSELQLAEFIYEQPTVGDLEYTFKHALTHEVAYHSVLNERRRLLHGRIGAALESMYADSLDDHVAELAHHYARSGNPEKGVEYCLRALEQCGEHGSHAEAVAHFGTGLDLLQKLPDDDQRAELELDLRNAVGDALRTIKGWASPEVEQSSARALELCQRAGINWEKTFSAFFGVLSVLLFRPDIRKACEISAEVEARAKEHESAEHAPLAEYTSALARMYSGDFELAAEGFDRAWAIFHARTLRRIEGLAAIRALSGWNLWFLGYPGRALERVSVATAIAHESGSKAVQLTAHNLA